MPSVFSERLSNVPYDPSNHSSSSSIYYNDNDIEINDENIGLPFTPESAASYPYNCDEDIGLRDDFSISEDLIGLEDEIQVDRQQLANMETLTPQDPIHTPILHLPNNQMTGKQKFDDVVEELICTLASKVAGYKNIHELKKDFRQDSGYEPDMIAAENGFANFETFVSSKRLEPYVSVRMVDGEPVYLPKDCTKFEHIRSEQELAENAELLHLQKSEEEKFARAQLPRNREAAINGRKIICEIIHELEDNSEGGKVSWNQIQTHYIKKYGKDLTGDELRQMFQRDKALRIIETFFSEDLNLYNANKPGQFFVKFKKPYGEIIANLDEQLRLHKERLSLLNTTGVNHHNKSNGFRRKEVIYATESMYPILDDNINPEENFAGRNVNEPSTSTKISKFNVPASALLGSSLKNETNAHNSSSGTIAKVSWSELDGYKMSENLQINTASTNGTGNKQNDAVAINNNCHKAKTNPKYTKCAGSDYTDSEVSDNDDNIMQDSGSKSNMLGQTGVSQMNDKITALKEKPITTSRLSTHQAAIQNHMRRKVEEKKLALNDVYKSEQMATASSSNNKNKHLPPIKCVSSSDDESTISNKKTFEFGKQDVGQSTTGYNDLAQQQNDKKIVSAYQMPTTALTTTTDHAIPNNPLGSQVQSVTSSVMCSHHKQPSSTINTRWALMEKIEELRMMANKMQLLHENRRDECSFTFYKGSTMLVLTEFHDQLRASKHIIGDGISKERYYPKVDWEMFSQTIRGALVEIFGALTKSTNRYNNICIGLNMPTNSTNVTTTGNCWGHPPANEWNDSEDLRNSGISASTSTTWEWECPVTKIEDNPDLTIKFNARRNNCDNSDDNNKSEECMYKLSQNSNIHFPIVPSDLLNRIAPFPASRCTNSGQNFLCFYTKIYGFSNHYPSSFVDQDSKYCCSEQYYMYYKAKHFGFNVTAHEIMHTSDSSVIKRLGCADNLRQRQKDYLEPDSITFDHDEWRRIKRNIMMKALRAKFNQNIFLYNMLVQTQSAYLVETSPYDFFWGNGCHMDGAEITNPLAWRGQNWMGQLLMQLRKEFIQQITEYDNEDKYKDTW